MERPTPPWTNELPEGAFVTGEPTYPTGKYFNRFKKDEAFGLKYYYFDPTEHGYPKREDYPLLVFFHGTSNALEGELCINYSGSEMYASDDYQKDEAFGLKYYYFDPTEHGYPKRNDYPLLVFFHGTSNALEGELCINYSGSEMYASDDYQKDLGGAYILMPMANEYRDENGRVQGAWEVEYVEPVTALIDDFVEKHMDGCKAKILLGNSSGGRFTFTISKHHPEKFDIILPVGSCEIPSDEVLDDYDKNGVTLFLAICKHDEFTPFNEVIEPRLERIRNMKSSFIFTPDWTYNGDKGVASINFGIEMGQHCLMNEIQMNVKFDDGTPMDESLPNGVTGWIANELKKMD